MNLDRFLDDDGGFRKRRVGIAALDMNVERDVVTSFRIDEVASTAPLARRRG